MHGQSLDDYESLLCQYALGNVRCYMQKPSFARWIEENIDNDQLISYLKRDSVSDVCLTDEEWGDLESVTEGFNETWVPWQYAHIQHLASVKEIRECLSNQAAEDWSEVCGRCARQLNSGLRLTEGIQVIREWLVCLHQLRAHMPAATSQIAVRANPKPLPRCRKARIPKYEATFLVREFLRKNRKRDITIREISRETGVATGAISRLSPWQALQVCKLLSRSTEKGRAPREFRLTAEILQSIGRAGPALTGLEAAEAVMEHLREKATPEERERWEKLTAKERAELIRGVVEQRADDVSSAQRERS
jgi:hypothetical protein